jgi:hypothetical protein
MESLESQAYQWAYPWTCFLGSVEGSMGAVRVFPWSFHHVSTSKDSSNNFPLDRWGPQGLRYPPTAVSMGKFFHRIGPTSEGQIMSYGQGHLWAKYWPRIFFDGAQRTLHGDLHGKFFHRIGPDIEGQIMSYGQGHHLTKYWSRFFFAGVSWVQWPVPREKMIVSVSPAKHIRFSPFFNHDVYIENDYYCTSQNIKIQ